MEQKTFRESDNSFWKRNKIFIFSYLIFAVGIVLAFVVYEEFYTKLWPIAIALSVSLGGVMLGLYAYSCGVERNREEKRTKIMELSEGVMKLYTNNEKNEGQ